MIVLHLLPLVASKSKLLGCITHFIVDVSLRIVFYVWVHIKAVYSAFRLITLQWLTYTYNGGD